MTRINSLENEWDKLLDDIYRTWGFCLHRVKRQEIVLRDRLNAREFAFDVLRLEGFPQPEYEVRWLRRLSQRFNQHFGRSTVTASDFDQNSN